MKKFLRVLGLLVLLGLPFQSARAQGGPPLLTDDPETPGNGHWEINFGFTFERSPARTLFETPRADFNYGLGSRIQLKYEIPWTVLVSRDAPAQTGLGNSLVGIKWRFLDKERHGISVSAYPQLEFTHPTSSADKGLVDRGKKLLLPIELARKIGPFETTWEWGYHFRERQKDEWVYGVALGHALWKRLELLGEMHGTALRSFGEDELLFDVGGRLRLTQHTALIYTSGRSMRGPRREAPTWFGYIGMQLNF